MKLPIVNLKNEKIKEIALPFQFQEEARADIIMRAVHALQSHRRQPYGSYAEAGKRHSAYVSKRRRDYRTTYGIGQSRTPRKVMSRRGSRFFWVGAVAPQTVGGREAHPPKASKLWHQKINRKERRKAIRSAIAYTILKDIVKQRGHLLPKEYPFAIEDSFEQLQKTKEVVDVLKGIGLGEELGRAEKKKVRAGKGKARGRRYMKKKGPLLVVSQRCQLVKAASNIPGIDVVEVNNLNVELLAPGGMPGRITIWTESSLERLGKERLFV